MRYELMIDEVAPSPNTYLRAHWSRYSGVKRRWGWLIGAAGTPPAQPLRRAAVSICRYGRRRLDPDNLVGSCKPVLDALRLCGYLADDTADHIRLDVRQAKLPAGQQPCTLIVIDAVERIATGEMLGDKQ